MDPSSLGFVWGLWDTERSEWATSKTWGSASGPALWFLYNISGRRWWNAQVPHTTLSKQTRFKAIKLKLVAADG